MNNAVPEQDRTLQDFGFGGLKSSGVTTEPPTAYEVEALGSPPGQLTHPLVNQVKVSSDSDKIDVGPSAHDITMRTR
jgi:hypothetical protein